MMWGWNGGWGVFWMILSWVVIVAVVVLVVRAMGCSWSSSVPPRNAREILDERFARGELSEEEYRERRRILEENRR
jgi:putative membrane protein